MNYDCVCACVGYVCGWRGDKEEEALLIKQIMCFLGILEAEKLWECTTPSVQRFNACGIGVRVCACM